MWWRTVLGVVSLLFLGMVSAQAQSPTNFFGAKLTTATQPTNTDSCDVNASHPLCSWVLMQAFGCEFAPCTNGHLAPKTGTIGTIRLISCTPGWFVLQIAAASPTSKTAKVFVTGPSIQYVGSNCNNGPPFVIQSFPVNVPVKKGEYLALAAQFVSFVNCSGGSNNTLLWDPPLANNAAGPRKSNGGDGCFLLLQALYK
jgi:hypothetical protein